MPVLCSFGHWSQALISQSLSVLLCPACGKSAFSGQINILLSGGHFWSGFQYTASRFTQPVHREHCVAPWVIHPCPGSCLVEKILTCSKPTLGLVFFTESTLPCTEEAP